MAAAHCFVLVVGWGECAFLSSSTSPTMSNAMSMIPIVSSAKDDLVDGGLDGGLLPNVNKSESNTRDVPKDRLMSSGMEKRKEFKGT